jgi:hypothetical protein
VIDLAQLKSVNFFAHKHQFEIAEHATDLQGQGGAREVFDIEQSRKSEHGRVPD